MSIKDDVREFLTTRRAKVTPEQAGLPTLRRQAPRAGPASRGGRPARGSQRRLLHPARARQPGRGLGPGPRGTRPSAATRRGRAFTLVRPRPSLGRPGARLAPCRGLKGAPGGVADPRVARRTAYVRNARLDILAANELAFVLYDGILDRGRLPLNLARFLFLDGRAPEFFLGWETVADDAVAALRIEAGHNPHDKSLTDLVGETRDEERRVRVRWARHNVKHHRTATKRLHNSLVGDLEVTGEAMALQADGLVIITYTVEPDSAAAEALRFLSSRATQHAGEPVEGPIAP